MRCAFPCRSCGFQAPLEGVELGTAVDCQQCGALQRFDPSRWEEALSFAHDVGDLAGPSSVGRTHHPRIWIGEDNPHREIGKTRTFGELDLGALRVEASPGYPSCTKCRALYEITFSDSRVSTRCPRCGDSTNYEVPEALRSYSSAPRAIVSVGQCIDRKRTRIEQTEAGLVALKCPNCGGSVMPSGSGESMVECAYCHTKSILPSRARPRDHARVVQAPIFWVLFEGPSEKRNELEMPKVPSPSKTNTKKRGFPPLAGIELAPVRPGFDGRQFALNVVLTIVALAIGSVVVYLRQL